MHSTKLLGVLVAAAVVGSAVVGGVALGGTASAQEESGELRVIHAAPDAPAVDVYVDDEMLLDNVSFGAVSGYYPLAPGNYTVEVTAAGDAEEVLLSEDVEIEAGASYTAAAAGEAAEDAENPLALTVFSDDVEAPGEDEAAARLVHLSPDAPAVDVTVAETGDVLYDNVSFANASDYETVPAGDYTLEVRPATADNDGDVVTTFNVSLQGGTAYSAFAVGYLNPDEAAGDQSFTLIVATDAGGEGMAETPTPSDEEDGDETGTETATETAEPTATP